MTAATLPPCQHISPPIIASIPVGDSRKWTASCRLCATTWTGGRCDEPTPDPPEHFVAAVTAHLAQRAAERTAPSP